MGHYDDIRDELVTSNSQVEYDLSGGEFDLPGLDINLSVNGLPLEMFEFLDVLKFGASKYGNLNFLDKDGSKSSHKEMHDSMFHHLSMSFSKTRIDEESGLDHLLHLAARALMMYTRIARGMDK